MKSIKLAAIAASCFSFWSIGIALAGPNVYFGNLHSHTSYSDGSGIPSDAFAMARDVAHLDFLAITEHNHAAAENNAGERRDGILIATRPELYKGSDDSLVSAATHFNEDGRFIAIYAQEFSSISKGNHVNVFDVDQVIDVPNGAFDKLVDWLNTHPDSSGSPALIQFNHPKDFDDQDEEYGAADFDSTAEWIRTMDKYAELIEILNGPAMKKEGLHRSGTPMEVDYLYYLNIGFHLAPTGNQDNHYPTWGTITDTRTAVIADELTKPKLIDALRKRHVYATEDKNLRVIIRVNDHLCGDIIDAPALNSELSIKLSIRDDDEPQAEYKIDVFSDVIGGNTASVFESVPLEGDTPEGTTLDIEDIHFRGGAQYVFFRVTQIDEDGVNDRVWTAPIWFKTAGAEPVDPNALGAQANAAQFVASKRSRIYHLSMNCPAAKGIKASNRIRGANAARGRSLHAGCR